MQPLQLLLDVGSGSLVGFVLGLAGGGGSILAVPLMIYAVGVPSPHVAVGTSAVAVAVNAAAGLFGQARRGLVDWRSGGLFAAGGVLGALIGAQTGKLIGGKRLMILFAVLMLVVAASMLLRRRGETGEPGSPPSRGPASRLLGVGAGTGLLSGIFGIGGGFLIVPGLMSTAHLPAQRACATSLVAVAAFGLTTASSYAWSGMVSWWLAVLFVGGGTVGMMLGTRAAGRLASGRHLVPTLAGMICCVGIFILYRGLAGSA
ncbi:sulfite exporter TauE/SafE family protein [Acetobacteraceae bacterium KSS8]|uniref:Probable membrane transporter protein n=2 Tax=Endosaccharibacter trunci TaxID=2812733 RepID=A0ABT1W9Y6_9PROT|nr:sulfite exporter TauE/SafE family protein [Acetobacteraceae bacterium KSS8]